MMQMLDHNTYSSRNHQPFQFFPHQSLDGTSNTNNSFNQSTSLSTLDTAAAAIAATQRYRTPATPSTQQSFNGGESSQSLSQVPDLMPSDSWMLHSSQQTPRATHRFGHQRESSLSSLGSNGPASPYNANTSNPHIAVPDSGNDGYHDIGGGENNYAYSMGKPMSMSDNFYANAMFNNNNNNNRDSSITNNNSNNYHNTRNIVSGQHMSRDVSSVEGLSNLANQQQQKQRGDRGLAPAPELSIGGGNSSARSHPVSVASSVAGDSPATPSFHEPEDDCRRARNVFHNQQVPKLDRTMTDIYSDELYSPNFTITSASPPPQTQMAMSPSNDLFAQRLQAANSQHLSAVQSPVSSTSRDDQSPFRQGSPYASALNEFPQMSVEQMQHIGSARQINQRLKAERDDKELQQHMARNSAQQQGTPNTISPKDAMLDFNESDDGSNIPLFQPHETNSYNIEPTNNGTTNAAPRTISQHSSPSFQSMASTPIQAAAFNFSMPTNIQIPQQYPFIGHRQQQQQQQQQQQRSTPATSTYSRVSSTEASNSEGGDVPSQKPAGASADGGTYTCTYHGCTLRFETPALLQKHKREGHRQANALSHVKSPISAGGLPGSMLNSQAGPHKCERINPSTGKPCNTIFSRPYDLTRHEDTIHNARKQKVRCDLCTEEKTFSRADALTRHYRVCHPDVDFPGKHRRRGGVGV